MYVHHRPVAATFRLAIGALATIGAVLQFATLGNAAWRLFSTWTMLLTAVYFVVVAVISAFLTKRSLGKQNSPVFEGALLTANAILLVGVICFWSLGWSLPVTSGMVAALIYFVIPIMVILDYALFCRKGRLQLIYPFDWLVFPIIYTSLILLTALNHTDKLELAIPYPFLDYQQLGFENFALSLLIITILILIFAYALFIADFALSGKLAKRIVLPKLKAVVIEDVEETPISAQSQTATPPDKPKTPQPTTPDKSEVSQPKASNNPHKPAPQVTAPEKAPAPSQPTNDDSSKKSSTSKATQPAKSKPATTKQSSQPASKSSSKVSPKPSSKPNSSKPNKSAKAKTQSATKQPKAQPSSSSPAAQETNTKDAKSTKIHKF